MPRNGRTKDPAVEVTGPRSLTRLLGLFDVLAKSKDGMTLAELNQALKSPKSSLLNLLRPLVGHTPSKLLLASALGGGALLLAADILVRVLMLGTELKLGVLTALIGAPFFLWLIFRARMELES